ncbi:MAG: cadmium resistance transporter [Methanobacteriaceae archaeon]|nr:cadmium resistance transporter [Methanobacteriaceae archaeon]
METLILVTISISAFVATNLDDLFLLAAFFSSKDFSNTSVVLGQYLGLSTLISISIIASFMNLIISSSLISLMGFLPILIGIKNLIEINNKEGDDYTASKSIYQENQGSYSAFKVATVTVANGGDNLGVYIPLMASVETTDSLIIAAAFLILTGIWCILSYKLVYNRFIGEKILRYGHLILPFLLIGIGLVIVFRGGGIYFLVNLF